MKTDEGKYRQAEKALWASVGLSPTEQWVQLRGGENVRVQIVGDGPPVLFIHGGTASGASWAPLVREMTEFRCLVMDRPGCGLSDPVDGGAKVADITAVEAFANRLVPDVLDGLGVDRAHLVSTSFGGYFAARGAANHPERVDRLVELTWMMGAPVSHAPMSMRMAAIPGLGQLMTKIPPTRFALKMILKQLGLGRALAAGKISEEFIQWFLAVLGKTNTMANELRANPQIITPIKGLNENMIIPDELLGKIVAPVLFIWGGEDPMGGEETARPFAAKFPDATVHMLPLAGHAPWIDEPELCGSLASDFFRAANR